MFKAMWRWLLCLFSDYSEALGDAIDEREGKKVLWFAFLGLVVIFASAGFIISLTYGVVTNGGFLFTWIGLPILTVYCIIYWLRLPNSGKEVIGEPINDSVAEELMCQRAREQYDDLNSLMFNAIQEAAFHTPLDRPTDLFSIQTSSPKGDHFYLHNGVPIFQFECYVDTTLEKVHLDIIQKEVQRNVQRHVSRYPLLISIESHGRTPVEVLDVKNCGGHVLIEVVLTTDASISLIEARRRARIERQQRSAEIYDRDF